MVNHTKCVLQKRGKSNCLLSERWTVWGYGGIGSAQSIFYFSF